MVLDISSDETSEEVSECSDYVPDTDSDVLVVSSSDDSDDDEDQSGESDDGEYQSDESDREAEEESIEKEGNKNAETEEDRYDKVMKLLTKGGDLNGLKLEEIKAYLRKHGLRITGTKSVCIQRVHEHRKIKDGGGQKAYPKSSFVINCRGDVCTGDIVLFTQKVYEKYDLASRGGAQNPIGRRTIAGKVVKESYGAAKQQHTFTVEILWSIGVKPLPPLYPLLIKGRNLYRMRTYRQPWPNEAEREKVLAEKHARGAEARSVRTAARVKYGSTGHKHSQNSCKFESPSKRRKVEKLNNHSTSQKSSWKEAACSNTQRPLNQKGRAKSNECPSFLAAPVRNVAVSEARVAVNHQAQNINARRNSSFTPRFSHGYNHFYANGFHKQQMDIAFRNQIMHHHPTNREEQSLHKFRPTVSYPFDSNIRRVTVDPYVNLSSAGMSQNLVRSDHFVPSFHHGNPREEWTRISGMMPPPQVISRPNVMGQQQIPADVTKMWVPKNKPARSVNCSFSGCRDLAAKDCVNSSCSQCCRRIGRRCKRHNMS
ncbi:hypothetical protein SUGI_1020980 [Cryptomeria japonica]|nr:hypothetical protein SUGI_1020980 [Cryptomeria japonica]